MRCVLIAMVLLAVSVVPTSAQDRGAELRAQLPYEVMAAKYPGLTVDDYDTAIRILAQMPDLVAQVAQMPMRAATTAPTASQLASGSIALNNPPPPRPATPAVPRITYPTTRGTYAWEAAHLRNQRR